MVKSPKMKNMTDEERVLYMEQKMMLEAEARKKKEDLLNELLKEKLIKEEKNSKNNLNKINYQWRSIMRDAKAKELLKDIEIMSQTFERIIDRKDSVIKSLVKDLQEAEEQYEMAMRSYFENTDNLCDMHTGELEVMRKKCEKEIEIIKLEFDKEKEFILNRHTQEMNELTTIVFGMEKTYLDQETEAQIEFHSVRDDLKNKNLEEKQQLRVNLEMKVHDLWNQFNQAMRNYEEITEDRKRTFDDLKEKDEKSAKEIDMQMRKIQSLTDNITIQKSKIQLNIKDSQDLNDSIKKNRDVMNHHFHDLKSQMKSMQDKMRANLTTLTIQSDQCLKELKNKEDKAQQILRFAEMCRKLETEEEKILPFYASSLTEEEENDLKRALYENPGKDLSDTMKDYLSLENFWKRYNKVLLDKTSLDKEKQMLSTENAQLRMLLKQYLDGISVNDEVLSQTNPLLIVNNRTNVRMNAPIGNGMVDRNNKVVIEAKLHLKNTI